MMQGEYKFLLPLMQRPTLARVKVKPEENLSILCADWLREITINGTLRAIWFHVPNEGKRSRIVAAIMRAMGLIPGVADFCMVWPRHTQFIELKVEHAQTTNQHNFEQWCIARGVSYTLCYSLEKFQEIVNKLMKEWQI